MHQAMKTLYSRAAGADTCLCPTQQPHLYQWFWCMREDLIGREAESLGWWLQAPACISARGCESSAECAGVPTQAAQRRALPGWEPF